MTDRCLQAEDLDDLVEETIPPAWRDHLQTCAACRALLAEYRSFLAAMPAPGADPVAAEEALARRLEAALPELREPAGPPRRPIAPSGRRPLRLTGARWRPALATAVVAAALLLVFWPGEERFTEPSGRARGPEVTPREFVLGEPELGAGGLWLLQWSPIEQATEYRIEVLDRALAVVLARSGDRAVQLELDPAAMPEGALPPWFVRVVALAGGRELARTPLRELPRRP
jgi:hypothetical protein